MSTKKHNLSSQDVRTKILELRDALVVNLEFLQQCIDKDLIELQRHFSRFGDLNYRPVLLRDDQGVPMTYGERTEVMLEPVASKYRATIKSLLDSIRLIETEILPEDDPEGSTAKRATTQQDHTDAENLSSDRAKLRASYLKGMKTDPNAPHIAPPQELVESEDITSMTPNRTAIEPQPKAEPNPTPLPWRQTTPQAQTKTIPKQKHVVKEPASESTSKSEAKEQALKGPVGLSPKLRAMMQGSRTLEDLKAKYTSTSEDDSED